MSFCCAIFLDIPYFRSYDLIAKPNGTYVTAVLVVSDRLNDKAHEAYMNCSEHNNLCI